MADIKKRKKDHIDITLNQPVRFNLKTNGLEKWDFQHHALPEIDLRNIDISCTFLGKILSFPFMIAGMTGGFENGEKINRQLAGIAEKCRVAFGTGSMRALIKNKKLIETYRQTRKSCSSVPFIGNIGAVNLGRDIPYDFILSLAHELEMDALAVHLNPLQEAVQPEGDTDFSGVVDSIAKLTTQIPVPIIVKETGAGISSKTGSMLKNAGVKYIDLSGAGGTSWAAVESFRSDFPETGELFRNWGIPLADCIIENRDKGLYLIASGGIDSGLAIAKSLALGANLAASALPVLKCLAENGEKGVIKFLEEWRRQLRIAMFLTSSQNIAELNDSKIRLV